MKKNIGLRACFLLAITGLFILISIRNAGIETTAQSASDDAKFNAREEAHRANNRGVAQLEQFNPSEAVKEFRKALEIYPELKIGQVNLAIALLNTQEIDQAKAAAERALELAPDLLQTQYVVGLIARNQNRTDDAKAAFLRVLSSDPNDVGSNINLGQIYTQERKFGEAIVHFRKAFEAEPYNSTAIYNLATSLIRNEQRDEGQKLIERFQALRKSGAATSIGQNYLEQGRYAEALVSNGAEPELVDATDPNIVFQLSNVAPPGKKTGRPTVSRNAARSAANLFDYDNDDDLDVIELGGTSRVRLLRNDAGRYVDVSARSADLAKSDSKGVSGVVAGDFDNDYFEDILFFGRGRPALLKGNGKGAFSNVSSRLPSLSGRYSTGAFADVDHDGDLDIFLGSSEAVREMTSTGPNLRNKLIRNNGDGTFTDISAAAKIDSAGRAVAVIPTDFDNRRDMDLLVLNHGKKPNLFQNLRDGTFRDVAEEVGLGIEDKWLSAAAGDFNKDGFVDFFFGRESRQGIFAVSDGAGKFSIKDAPLGTEGAISAQFLDFDNDGLLDLIVSNAKGLKISRNLGKRWSTTDARVASRSGQNTTSVTAGEILSGDLDRDGDADLLLYGNDQPLQLLTSTGAENNRSTAITLKGRVSNRTGVGSKIDMRSGSLSQKLESYAASPMPAPSDIHFGLGRRSAPDAVRVIWPSGVIQAEIGLPRAGDLAAAGKAIPIEELDRKPSSCPYLYTWNGREFEFISDFLGGGEMGNWKEHGSYHFPDSDEYVRIASDKLKPKNGKYEIRVTNELEEVLFLDHLKLIAVEHPEGTEIYPNEGLGIPTSGKRLIYTTHRERPPRKAFDSDGRDVLSKVKDLDRLFYDAFKPTDIRGYSETHTLTLDLDVPMARDGRVLLLMTGWTDYAFSSDNLAASQSGRSLYFPKLQVKNRRGEWETVIDSIGISVGRPQTVVVDLGGKFLSDSREVRIVTNVRTYWDKISVSTSYQGAIAHRELVTDVAELRDRGFSEEISFSGMIVPKYQKALNDGRWKYFPGNFTRHGDVRPLLNSVDDVFVISKTGDELVLSFDALPEPPSGRKYTFLLFADGYSKEMDINSGSPDVVLPLPFKGMAKYPYGVEQNFPMTAEKQRLYDEFTTRTVTRPLSKIEALLIR